MRILSRIWSVDVESLFKLHISTYERTSKTVENDKHFHPTSKPTCRILSGTITLYHYILKVALEMLEKKNVTLLYIIAFGFCLCFK